VKTYDKTFAEQANAVKVIECDKLNDAYDVDIVLRDDLLR
jgi:hypothetical protein